MEVRIETSSRSASRPEKVRPEFRSLRGFDMVSLVILLHFGLCMAYLLSILGARIRAVDLTPSDSAIGPVRTGLGQLAALHHVGLFTAASVAVLQVVFALTR